MTAPGIVQRAELFLLALGTATTHRITITRYFLEPIPAIPPGIKPNQVLLAPWSLHPPAATTTKFTASNFSQILDDTNIRRLQLHNSCYLDPGINPSSSTCFNSSHGLPYFSLASPSHHPCDIRAASLPACSPALVLSLSVWLSPPLRYLHYVLCSLSNSLAALFLPCRLMSSYSGRLILPHFSALQIARIARETTVSVPASPPFPSHDLRRRGSSPGRRFRRPRRAPP